ncbi:MAG: hypothetical protein A2W26_10575 [Acidobacteria bacterium RBG_16_64_8]|nr:MAG: hypothetical protein A2W26_10575 [Acidobacteria bacterium RBG_16_64_8]
MGYVRNAGRAILARLVNEGVLRPEGDRLIARGRGSAEEFCALGLPAGSHPTFPPRALGT